MARFGVGSAALLALAPLGASSGHASAQTAASTELARELANPVSSLISLPFQNNYDCCFGPSDAGRYLLNIQPVVPTKLNADWTLVIRTILPVISLEAPVQGLGDTFGLGDTLQSFFFVPRAAPGGIIWGAGPAIQWPTGTDEMIRSGKWAAGPTAVILKQQNGWTYGALSNHVWSFADAAGGIHPDVNQTFIQPFLAYTWKDSTTLTLNSESTYNWTAEEWTVPINLIVSRIYNFGHQPVSLGVGGRWYAETPHDSPDWGVRAFATFLFPTGG